MAKRVGDELDEFVRDVKRARTEAVAAAAAAGKGDVVSFTRVPQEVRLFEYLPRLRLSALVEYSTINNETRAEAMSIFSDLCRVQFRSPVSGQPLALYTEAARHIDGAVLTFSDLYLFCNQRCRAMATLMVHYLFGRLLPRLVATGDDTVTDDSGYPPVTWKGLGYPANVTVDDPQRATLSASYPDFPMGRAIGLSASVGIVAPPPPALALMRPSPVVHVNITWILAVLRPGYDRHLEFAPTMHPFSIPPIILLPANENVPRLVDIAVVAKPLLVVGTLEVTHSIVPHGVASFRCTVRIRVLRLDIDRMQAVMRYHGGRFGNTARARAGESHNGSMTRQLLQLLPDDYSGNVDGIDDDDVNYVVDDNGRALVFD